MTACPSQQSPPAPLAQLGSATRGLAQLQLGGQMRGPSGREPGGNASLQNRGPGVLTVHSRVLMSSTPTSAAPTVHSQELRTLAGVLLATCFVVPWRSSVGLCFLCWWTSRSLANGPGAGQRLLLNLWAFPQSFQLRGAILARPLVSPLGRGYGWSPHLVKGFDDLPIPSFPIGT